MAKFYGSVGYVESKETSPGVWTDTVMEKKYRGDVFKISKRWQKGEGLNDDITVNNEISIIADPFAYSNIQNIKYVVWIGSKWKVTQIHVARPRLTLIIGGVYNGV